MKKSDAIRSVKAAEYAPGKTFLVEGYEYPLKGAIGQILAVPKILSRGDAWRVEYRTADDSPPYHPEMAKPLTSIPDDQRQYVEKARAALEDLATRNGVHADARLIAAQFLENWPDILGQPFLLRSEDSDGCRIKFFGWGETTPTADGPGDATYVAPVPVTGGPVTTGVSGDQLPSDQPRSAAGSNGGDTDRNIEGGYGPGGEGSAHGGQGSQSGGSGGVIVDARRNWWPWIILLLILLLILFYLLSRPGCGVIGERDGDAGMVLYPPSGNDGTAEPDSTPKSAQDSHPRNTTSPTDPLPGNDDRPEANDPDRPSSESPGQETVPRDPAPTPEGGSGSTGGRQDDGEQRSDVGGDSSTRSGEVLSGQQGHQEGALKPPADEDRTQDKSPSMGSDEDGSGENASGPTAQPPTGDAREGDLPDEVESGSGNDSSVPTPSDRQADENGSGSAPEAPRTERKAGVRGDSEDAPGSKGESASSGKTGSTGDDRQDELPPVQEANQSPQQGQNGKEPGTEGVAEQDAGESADRAGESGAASPGGDSEPWRAGESADSRAGRTPSTPGDNEHERDVAEGLSSDTPSADSSEVRQVPAESESTGEPGTVPIEPQMDKGGESEQPESWPEGGAPAEDSNGSKMVEDEPSEAEDGGQATAGPPESRKLSTPPDSIPGVGGNEGAPEAIESDPGSDSSSGRGAEVEAISSDDQVTEGESNSTQRGDLPPGSRSDSDTGEDQLGGDDQVGSNVSDQLNKDAGSAGGPIDQPEPEAEPDIPAQRLGELIEQARVLGGLAPPLEFVWRIETTSRELEEGANQTDFVGLQPKDPRHNKALPVAVDYRLIIRGQDGEDYDAGIVRVRYEAE